MMEAILNNFYSRSNDVATATDDAGYSLTVVKTHAPNNLSFGPWQGKGYMGVMKEGTMDMRMSWIESEPVFHECATVRRSIIEANFAKEIEKLTRAMGLAGDGKAGTHLARRGWNFPKFPNGKGGSTEPLCLQTPNKS
jgi:hypothetical protein